MHRFNLEIEIPDKDYCNGCPCLFEYDMATGFRCKLFNKRLKDNDDGEIIDVKVYRPEICKQNDKEKKSNVV